MEVENRPSSHYAHISVKGNKPTCQIYQHAKSQFANLPGLSRARSIMSGLLVAATTKTPSRPSTPSSAVRSWFTTLLLVNTHTKKAESEKTQAEHSCHKRRVRKHRPSTHVTKDCRVLVQSIPIKNYALKYFVT